MTQDAKAPQQDQPLKTRTNYLVPDAERWSDPNEPIISLKDVRKSFGKDHILKGLSLDIMPGKITVIIGASASGKSVLIKMMNGLAQQDSGEIRLIGEDPTKLSSREVDALRKRMGTLFQNYALFDSMTVRQNVAFPLIENDAMKAGPAYELAEELMTQLDLPHTLDSFPSSLSGGMKKRVALARAIVTNPEIMLLDEPTTGLDPVMMEFVDELIQRVTEQYQLTTVIISHDMASTFRLADSIAVLYDGKIIAHDVPEAIKASTDERVRALIMASDKSAIELDTSDRGEDGPEPETAVRVRGLWKSFDGRNVLQGVDISAPLHGITVLIGGSGSGKSVLMKHILGLFKPDKGEVSVFGQDMVNISEQELSTMRTRIGMLFQHSALFDSMSVLDNVAFPLTQRSNSISVKEANERAMAILEQLKLTSIHDRMPTAISNGQQKRVSLARAIISKPELMIYDEPTTGQDPIMCAYVEDMIVEAQETFNLTSLIISHDMASTFRIGDHVAMLYKGVIIAEGHPRSLLESTDERVREFVFAADIVDQ